MNNTLFKRVQSQSVLGLGNENDDPAHFTTIGGNDYGENEIQNMNSNEHNTRNDSLELKAWKDMANKNTSSTTDLK